MTNITPVVSAVLALAAAVLTAFVIPWLRNKTGAQRADELQEWVKILVAAAEQTYKAANGKQKKEYVLTRLREMGLFVDEKQVSDAIEAAVLELHHKLYWVSPS